MAEPIKGPWPLKQAIAEPEPAPLRQEHTPADIKRLAEQYWREPGLKNPLNTSYFEIQEVVVEDDAGIEHKQGEMFVMRRGQRVPDAGHEKQLREYLASIRKEQKT